MLRVLKPGLLTSVQDLGRSGYQKYGVIASGVMDQLAHRLSNILVGNEENEATLEITLLGPVIQFEKNALIAICGGDLSPSIDGIPIKMWRPIYIKKGRQLSFGHAAAGARSYLAVAGGFDIPEVMGSKSTYLRANIGGFHGRALNSGDSISFNPHGDFSQLKLDYLSGQAESEPFTEMDWSVSSDLIPLHRRDPSIRVIRGRQFDLFSEDSKTKLFQEPFLVTPQSDRMGYRLKGPSLQLEKPEEMISEAVNFGTIQVPSEGNPIILLADRQTTGGYPKIGQIATVDLPLIVQAKPGDHIRFKEISHEKAQALYLKREENINKLKQGILLKFR
jgi:antagonist of KipI